MICRIADFTVEFQNTTKDFEDKLIPYQTTDKPQATFTISEGDLAKTQAKIKVPLSPIQLESSYFYNKFIDWIPTNDILFFHASLICVHGEGVAFTALSGTGKTTHTFLWQRLLGEKMEIINGDKPIIRFNDGNPYGYGSPWCGKENLSQNKKVPLKHVCFIERSNTNSCEQITPQEALKLGIFSQVLIPRNPDEATTTLALIDRLLKHCTLWRIKCNMDISAAKVAYNTIFGGNQDEA